MSYWGHSRTISHVAPRATDLCPTLGVALGTAGLSHARYVSGLGIIDHRRGGATREEGGPSSSEEPPTAGEESYNGGPSPEPTSDGIRLTLEATHYRGTGDHKPASHHFGRPHARPPPLENEVPLLRSRSLSGLTTG